MSKKIYVNGTGGLGNSLFQIASAIYYKETYGGNILLQKNDTLMYGTSNKFNKIQNMTLNATNVPYTNTILSKFDFYNKINNAVIVNNAYENIKYTVKGNENILIRGYCQNINLFKPFLHKIPKYLNLEDETIINFIKSKYKNINNGILISLRVGSDFAHMKKITRNSYINALKKFKDMNININNLFIVSDIPNAWVDKFDLQDIYPATFINENDIVQIYAGLMCKHYILCESTFHLWIAYLGTINDTNKKVIVFKDTDLTNRPLSFDNWIQIDC